LTAWIIDPNAAISRARVLGSELNAMELWAMTCPHRYLKGSRFFDPKDVGLPMTFDEKKQAMKVAEDHELATQKLGCPTGALGWIGLKVFTSLLWDFHNCKSGECYPSIRSIMRKTGLCRQSVVAALKRLARHGYITRLRRMVWRIIDGIRRAVQASNCYRLHAPVRHAVILRDCARDAHPSRIAFPKPAAKPAPLLSWREGMAAKVIRAPAAVKTSYPANGAALGAGGYPQSGSAEKTPDYHASLRDRQKPQDSKKDADLRVFQREGWQIPRASLLETGLMRRHLRA
jgi:hypothetical protein